MRISSLLVLCLALTMSIQAPAAEPAAKIETLLVTGDDIGPFHDWRENSEASREALEATGRFEVRVCEDPSILESKTALKAYDVIVFVLYNHTLPDISDAAKENLVNFVKGGKGFVSTHLSSASFKDWEEYGKLVGRKWVMGVSGHNPRNVFESKIANSNHPITKGLKDFKIFDELYANLQGKRRN